MAKKSNPAAAATGKLADDLRYFAELKVRKKELDDLTKENNELIKQTEKALVSSFLDVAESAGFDDPSAFKVTCDGHNYGVTNKHYFSIKAENKDEAYAALRDIGLGDLIVEKVDNRTLTKSLQQVIENNDGVMPESYAGLADMLTEYDEPGISDRKVNA